MTETPGQFQPPSASDPDVAAAAGFLREWLRPYVEAERAHVAACPDCHDTRDAFKHLTSDARQRRPRP